MQSYGISTILQKRAKVFLQPSTYRSNVWERERSPCEVDSPQLSRRSQRLQAVELHCEFEDAEHLYVLYVGNQKTLIGVHRQSDIMSSLEEKDQWSMIYLDLTQNIVI